MTKNQKKEARRNVHTEKEWQTALYDGRFPEEDPCDPIKELGVEDAVKDYRLCLEF